MYAGPHGFHEYASMLPGAAGFAHNQIWVAIAALALELTAWPQTLALTHHDARRWEPKRLRLRLFSIAGRIAQHAR